MPMVLGDDDGRAAGQADEKVQQQRDDGDRRAAHGGQRSSADELAEYDGVDHGVKLLEQRPGHDRQGKAQ